jgi:hypothetical protein
MSKVIVEFDRNPKEKNIFPLWFTDNEDIYQVIRINDVYILVDVADVKDEDIYLRYDSVDEILNEYPELIPVDVKITVL